MMRQSSAPRACAALLAGLVLMLAAPGRVDAGQCQSSCGQAQPQPGLRIGGSAEGFAGELVLGLNAGFDTLVLAQPGAFRFARRVPQGQVYQVRVLRHPTGLHCTVSAGQGLALGEVADVQVRCSGGHIAALPVPQGEAADAAPLGPLLLDAGHNLYAIAARGGQHGHGAVVRIAADGTRTLLHSFATPNAIGAPYRLALSADGHYLVGVSEGDGAYEQGTIFRLRRDGSNYQLLHSFGDGGVAVPSSGLLLASDGSFYGLSASDGSYAGGTLYRWRADEGLQVVHAFANPQDLGGDAPPEAVEIDALQELVFPAGELVEGDGVLYGAAMFGGLHRNGGVFGYRLQDARLSTLASLPPQVPPPQGGLVRGRGGELHGLTSIDSQMRSAWFRVGAGGQLDVSLLDPAQTAIERPRGVLLQGSDGRLYGVSAGGGLHGGGTLFSIDPEAGTTQVHFSFGGAAREQLGVAPEHGLLAAANGDLYGSTEFVGPHGHGQLFRID